jgi:hypothetical protein
VSGPCRSGAEICTPTLSIFCRDAANAGTFGLAAVAGGVTVFWRRKWQGEFRKTWFGVESREGFAVEIRSKNWIDHLSYGIRRRVFAEPMGLRNGWIVYRSATNRHGFDGLPEVRIAEIYQELSRALRFLGYAIDWVD